MRITIILSLKIFFTISLILKFLVSIAVLCKDLLQLVYTSLKFLYKNADIKIIVNEKRIYMNEENQCFSENLSAFLMGFRDEVVKGIQEYLRMNNCMNTDALN